MDKAWGEISVYSEDNRDLLQRCSQTLQAITCELDLDRKSSQRPLRSFHSGVQISPDSKYFQGFCSPRDSCSTENFSNLFLEEQLTAITREKSMLWEKYQVTLLQLEESIKENERLRANFEQEVKRRKEERRGRLAMRPVSPLPQSLFPQSDRQALTDQLTATNSLLDATQRELTAAHSEYKQEIESLREIVWKLEEHVMSLKEEVERKDALIADKERTIEEMLKAQNDTVRTPEAERVSVFETLEEKIRVLETQRKLQNRISQKDIQLLKEKLSDLASTGSTTRKQLPFPSDIDNRLSLLADRLQAKSEGISIRKSITSPQTFPEAADTENSLLLKIVTNFSSKATRERKSIM